MHFQLPTILVTALLSATSITALGINCQGSYLCKGYKGDIIGQMYTDLHYNYPNGGTFTAGQQIVCVDHICAFLQNTSGTKTFDQVRQYLGDLSNHQCKICGSDPTEPGNNVATGQLTVNYVSDITGPALQ